MSERWTHIFFDIGGVLGTNGWDGQQRAAARQRFGLEAEFEDRHAEVAGDWETGLLDLDEYLDCTVFYRPREFTREAFITFMKSQSVPDAEVLALVHRIGAAGGSTLMTMNNEAEFLNLHRIETFGLRELFSAFLSSCWLGTRKPARRFFEHGLAIAQADPARSIFVDDREQNLTPARALGMTVVHFTGTTALAEALRGMGL
ncbi:MAG TPA: HAD-IA family hydrolase [Gemmatimonadales bacterium]|nr:HAD-IA family hydrolase [Gemmatimonadales bacterium]